MNREIDTVMTKIHDQRMNHQQKIHLRKTLMMDKTDSAKTSREQKDDEVHRLFMIGLDGTLDYGSESSLDLQTTRNPRIRDPQ